MNPPKLSHLEQCFTGDEAHAHALPSDRTCAAVALIFRHARHPRSGPDDLELCFVRRAVVPGDPWSGDMAFPGGKGEDGDRTFHHVAARETFEETGLHIDDALLRGALPDVDVQFRGLLVRPMVYFAGHELGEFRLSHELDEAYWIGLGDLWDPGRRTTVDYGRLDQDYPGIRHDEHVIWGLTYRMLRDCAHLLGRPLPGA